MATDFPASPSNGDTHAGFTYNSTTGTWETSVSTSSIDLLVDVDTGTAAPSTGDLLQWNGTNWVPTGSVGITHLDTWRITSDITSDAVPITTWSNTAAYTTLQPTLGTAMSHSSGVFTFPVTGFWEVQFFAQWQITGNDNVNIGIQAYETDGTTLRSVSQATVGDSSYFKQINLSSYLNITNVSTQTTRFFVNGISSGTLIGDSTRDKTYVVFKRIAASV